MTGSAHLQAEPPVEVAGADELLAVLGVGFLRSALPMICLDKALNIVCANAAAHGLLSAGVLVGRSFSAFCAELPVPAQWWDQERPPPADSQPPEVDLQLMTDSGELLDADTLIEQLVVDGRGRLLLLQIRDVTDDRVRARQLAASERRYRQLTEAIPDSSVVLFDRDLRLMLAAGEALPDAGLVPELFIGRHLQEVIGEEVFAILESRYRAALAGKSCDVDYTSPVLGRQYRIRVRPVTDARGVIVGGLAVSADVSAHRRRRDQLEQVRRLHDVGSCWFERGSGWACDEELKLLWGVETVGEDLPTVLTQLVVPDDRQAFHAAWTQAGEKGGLCTLRYRIRHQRTGELRFIRSAVTFVVDSDGVLVRAIATHVDITDTVSAREAATEALADGAAQRSALLRQIGDMLAGTHGGHGELLQGIVNIAALALDAAAVLCILTPDGGSTEQVLLGYNDSRVSELAEAMSLSTQCHEPGLLRRVVIEQGRILPGSTINSVMPEHHRRFYDQTGWLIEHSVSAPIRHNGKVLGIFTVFRSDPQARFQVGDDDLLQMLADRIGALFAESRLRRAAEQERDQRLRALMAQQKQLLDELAGMETRERSLLAESIHDEPIQLIVASIMRIDRLGLRAEPVEREELDKIASQLEVSVDWLRNLIVVALTPPELSEGLGIALSDLAEGIFLGSTRFCLEGPRDVTLSEGAKAAAFRILREALVNTRKHARAQNVTLRMSEHDGLIDISLTDDGVGAERIESTSGHLGLATMRARADAEGGRLRVDSAIGMGTTVTLTLPISGVRS